MSKKDKHESTGAASAAPTPDNGETLTADVEDQKAEMSPLELALSQVEEWKDYARRAQAEFENTRKRLEQRSVDATKRAGERVIESMLPVVDDLEYAVKHATESGNEMTDGIVAIHTKLLSAMLREGVEVIDPLDKPFDHSVAQAVSVVENVELPSDTVVAVLQKGYQLGGKVLRPAMVVVSSGGPTT